MAYIKKPTLTIAIPTYNNHKYLVQQLDRLRLQLNDEIIFYIIDNNSQPSVKDYFKSIKYDVNDLQIYVNDSNIGPDLNILKCINLSNTDWTWVLSDNDLVEDNAVNEVVRIIQDYQNAFFINFGYFEDFVGQGLEDFCKYASYVNSFAISNCLYNTKLLKSQLEIYEKSIKTHQGQLVFVLNYLAVNKDSYFHLSRKRLFNDSLSPQWPKSKFLIDSVNFLDHLPERAKKCIKGSRFGSRITGMQIILLSMSQVFEKLPLGKTLAIFEDVVKNSSIKQILSLQFMKSMLYLILSTTLPNVYKKKTKILFNKSFEFDTTSKNDYKF